MKIYSPTGVQVHNNIQLWYKTSERKGTLSDRLFTAKHWRRPHFDTGTLSAAIKLTAC